MKSKKNHHKLIQHGLFCLFSGSALFLLLLITQIEVAAEPQEKKSYGPKDLRSAASLNKKAQEYYERGKYSEAEPLLKKALTIREAVFGT